MKATKIIDTDILNGTKYYVVDVEFEGISVPFTANEKTKTWEIADEDVDYDAACWALGFDGNDLYGHLTPMLNAAVGWQ